MENKKYTDHLYIGKIDFSENIVNEVNIGSKQKFKNAGLCSVEVYGNEGPIPHFHLIGDNFHCCPCIYEPLYFNHGYKVDKLNNKELKILDKWLREPNSILPAVSNWQYIESLWINCNNPTKLCKKNAVQPHYEDMITMKG